MVREGNFYEREHFINGAIMLANFETNLTM